jgi:hypothetical protein
MYRYEIGVVRLKSEVCGCVCVCMLSISSRA